MTVLFIAPLPPPIHGQSLASDVLYRNLRERHDVRVVDMSKTPARHLWDWIRRAFRVVTFFPAVLLKRRNADVVYLSLSESRLGNLKDLCIYTLCLGKLDRMFVHMLGGAGIKQILESGGIQSRINRFFISRLAGVIVEGTRQAAVFSSFLPAGKVHVVHNFAEDFLFVGEHDVRQKFVDTRQIRVLFLSNLYGGKGHNELVDAYRSLDAGLQSRISIVFVGGFESDRLREAFMQRIDGQPGLIYLGNFIGGEEKKALYGKSHVFCLPTYYPYEGQPISILEAYATGCVVVTTPHSGIPDVFRGEVNGYEVETQSADSIRKALERIAAAPERLVGMALTNRNMAYDRYRTEIYQASVSRLLERAAV